MTDGGAHVTGPVNTGGGDFIGRDQHIHGNVQNSANVAGGEISGPVVGNNVGTINTRYVQFGNITPPTDDVAAQQRLATLPIDHVPTPGALPAPSRMPLLRNHLFVGREADLLDLAQALKLDTIMAIGPIAAATGMGGIGKTQLACEFAYRYGRFFAGGVWWLSFADAGAIKSEIAACGGPTLNPGYAELDLDAQVWLVRQAWESSVPRLLIFDNCEDPQLVREWKPCGGGCAVLLTSRRNTRPVAMQIWTLPLDV